MRAPDNLQVDKDLVLSTGFTHLDAKIGTRIG